MEYKIKWQNKETGRGGTGPVLMKEITIEPEAYFVPRTREEAWLQADSCNEKFSMAEHWVVEKKD